ncbi:MAG TPA: PAS domain S-box protein [Candidatus Acidoferrales bacterium]|nr:PAS domain S-box protein [Candidatus Acidoferrales bacterium]
MVGPGLLTIGWQHAAVSLLLCLVYALLYPQLRERAFRLWIAGWALSSLFGFTIGPETPLVRALALLAATGGSALLLGSVMEWIGWDRHLHYLWPLGLALIGMVSVGLVLAPDSVLSWWGAHLLHACFSIAAGWLLWRSPLRLHFPALTALSGALLLRGLHLLDPSHLPGTPRNPLQLHLDFALSAAVGVAMMVVVLSEIRRRARQFDLGLEHFAGISSAAENVSGTDELFRMVLERTAEHLRATAGWIGLVARDDQGSKLKLTYLGGFSDAFRREPPEFDMKEPWLGKMSAPGPHLFSVDDDSGNDLRRLLRSEHLGALLCAPVFSEEPDASGRRELTALLAAGSPNAREFTEADQRFLASVAGLVQVHEQRLRLSEQATRTKRQWIALLDEVEDPVLLHDDRYRIVQANSSATRRLGTEPDKLTGRLLRDVLRPGPRHWNHCPYCEEVAGHPDKRDPNFGGFLAATAATVEGTDGRPAVLHLLRDVTARRRAEEKLRDLFENMQEGAFLSTPGGRFLDFNEAFRRMLGFETREELLCADIPGELFANPVDRERLMKLLRDHGSVSGFEFPMRRKDGEIINVMESSVAVRDASGAVVAVQGFVLDVTERKHAELEIRRRNRELLLLNSIGQALSQPLELEDLLTRVLRQMTDLFDLDLAAAFLLEETSGGVERRAAVGMRSKQPDWGLPRVLPQELFEQIRRTHATVLPPQALASVSGFQSLTEDEGLQVWRVIVLWWKERVVGGLLVGSRTRSELAGAELNLLVAVANQIAARVETTALYEATRQALDTLRRTQEQLVQSEKMVAIGQLISGVAHELNNPLTAILGYSELLETSPGVSVQSGEFAVKIAKQAQRTQKIVQNLLSFARQQKPERRAVRLNDVLEDTLALRDYDWRRCRITIHRNLDPGLTEIQGDRHQLQQVFLNILNNAFDALKNSADPRSIWVRTTREMDRVLIEVTDSGAGVREPMRVFDPFYTTKPVGEGTGLGLSICYGILKEHGGEITVRNTAAGGASFAVYLPVAVGDASGERDASSPVIQVARPVPTGVSILLVDDEEAVLEVEREILREKGHTVHVAANVADATALLESVEVDVIVADFKLSGLLGGQELYGWVKHRRPALTDRLIFTFADGQSEDAAHFLAASGSPSLHKPFRVDELLSAVQAALAQRGASALME